MQTDTGNIGDKWKNAKFVDRFEMAAMQVAILSKAQQGEVTRDNLQQVFRGNLQMSGNHFDHCINQLVQDGHLKDVGGNKYAITDDGREDVQKLHNIVQELPNVVGQGQTQRPGMAKTTGGAGGNVNQPNVGGGQTKGGPGGQVR